MRLMINTLYQEQCVVMLLHVSVKGIILLSFLQYLPVGEYRVKNLWNVRKTGFQILNCVHRGG